MLRHENDYSNFKEILNTAKDIIYSINLIPNFRFTYINSAIYDVLEYSSKEILENPNIPFEIVHEDDKEDLIHKSKGNIDWSKPTTLRFISKSGSCKWIEDYIMPKHDNKGKLIGFYGIGRDVTKQKQLEFELKRLKDRDDLTDVYSRYFFNSEIDKINGKVGHLGIFLIDIDRLKLVNDTLGHLEGDEFICLVAQTLVKHIGKEGYVCRHGGDEFVIVIKDKDMEKCKKCYEILKKETIHFHGENRSFSIGFAHSNGQTINVKKLLKEADKDMYKNKLNRKFILEYT